jgi:outer membrane efflux protein
LLEAQIKQVLGRPQESADVVAETLTLRTLRYTAAELLQRAREQNPDVHSKQASIRQQETQVELAQKNFRPDFNVSYTYEHTADKFRDYYMATFGIRLPNRGRQKAELAEAQENKERARQELDAESQRVLSEVQQQYVRAKTAKSLLAWPHLNLCIFPLSRHVYKRQLNSELLTYPFKIIDGFGFIFSGANQNLSAFLRFPLKVRGSGVWGDRETAPHGCSSVSSGAATGLPFSPPRVRTKTCPLFAFSVEGARLRCLG